MAQEAQNSDIFQSLLKTVYDILKPVLEKFSDPEARKEVLESLGLPTDASPAPTLPATTNLQAYINKGETEVKPLQLAGAIADITAMMLVIEGVVVAAKSDDDERSGSEIVTALLNLLTLEFVRLRHPAFHSFLQLISVVDTNAAANGGSVNFIKDVIGGYFSRLGEGLDTEAGVTAFSDALLLGFGGGLFIVDKKLLKGKDIYAVDIKSAYGYEGLVSSATPVADGVANRTLTFAVHTEKPTPATVFLTMLFVPTDHGGISFIVEVHGNIKIEFDLNEAKTFKLKFDLNGDGIFRIGSQAEVAAGPNNKSSVAFENKRDDARKWSLLDKPVVQLGIGTYEIKLSASPDDFEIKVKVDLAYKFGRGGLSGFPFDFIPENEEGKTPLEFGYSVKRNFFFGGSGAAGTTPSSGSGSRAARRRGGDLAPRGIGEELVKFILNAISLRIPLHKTIGGVLGLETLYLRTDVEQFPSHTGLEVSLDFWLKFGSPLVISISRLGLLLRLDERSDSGGIGGYDLVPAIKPPNGAGIRVNAEVVTGGGFLYLDSAKGEYFGSLELSFKGLFALKAVGIINTKMPDGSDGFSLLIIITAEFSPVQLGFGFTLIGVGGLLGLNRTMDVEELRIGLRTGAIKSVLFPEDVVGNISRIISDIRRIFPIKEDSFLIGLMGKIGWGTPTLISIELGLLLELPDPRIVLLGVIKTVLPDERVALLKIQVNFLGVIDFQNEFVYFEARLYESHLVGFPLTGSLAFVVAWGRQSTFGISVGGFHPDFRDYPTVPTLPGAFRDMDRVSLQLLSGDNPRLGVECYFAVTSNSVQFGAKAELYAGGPMGFNLYGMLAFDALFIFNPFHFIISLEATLAIRHGEDILFGIHFKGSLSGPTPWHVEGEVSFSICWFITITIGFSATWGDPPPLPDTTTENLLEKLRAELSNNANWRIVVPDYHNLHVSLRELEEEEKTKLIIHPFGQLIFSQRALPLNYTIQKFGNHKPEGANFFKITGVKLGETPAGTLLTEREMFAPGHYTDLSESEKLSRKSFELMDSGVHLADAGQISVPQSALDPVELDYELDYTGDDNPPPKTGNKLQYAAFDHLSRNGASAKSAVSWGRVNTNPLNGPEKMAVQDAGFVVAWTKDMKTVSPDLQSDTLAGANQMLSGWLAANPDKAGQVQVLEAYEAN